MVLGRDLEDRMPLWLKSDLPDGEGLRRVMRTLAPLRLNTICFEARCPNKADCFARGSVTFLILGENCTRECGFCDVAAALPEPVDSTEPERLSRASRELGLDYVILTSVTRDDLPDGGALHFRKCVTLLKQGEGQTLVEVLTPDFAGDLESVDTVASAGPDVFGHNVETVERLYTVVRDKASYTRSLTILQHVRRRFPDVIVKSGLMLGLGETGEEVKSTIRDLSDAGCDIVTVGQYMRPSRSHLPVKEYIDPAVFEELESFARDLGLAALCGPKVRSSFRARAAFDSAKLRRRKCA
jgi:lipoic acid synthetase